MDHSLRGFLKAAAIQGLNSPKPSHLTNTLATLVATIVNCEEGLADWPALAPTLLTLLDSENPSLVEGAFNTLYFICEDVQEALTQETGGSPLNVLIPKCLQFFAHPNHVFRRYALGCINHYVLLMPTALLANLESYVGGLSALAQDKDAVVRQRVCFGIGLLADVDLPFLMQNLQGIIEFMLLATQDSEENVAMEATEFWSILCDSAENFQSNEAKGFVEAVLERLIPILVRGVAYNDEDPALDAEDENNDVADRAADIKPRFHKSRLVTEGNTSSDATDNHGNHGGEGRGSFDTEEEDDYDDDDDDDDDEDVCSYNLRKCSAASLDILSKTFGAKILPFLIPVLNNMFNHPDWKMQEASILALGAVAEGCMDGVQGELGSLFSFLLNAMLHHERALIRAITTWTMSRYSAWVVKEPTGTVLPEVIKGFLERVLDNNKKVQEDACSNLAVLEEEAGKKLVPYIGPMLQTFAQAFKIYQKKNLIFL